MLRGSEGAHYGRVQRTNQAPVVSAAEIPTPSALLRAGSCKKRKDGAASAAVIPEFHGGYTALMLFVTGVILIWRRERET